MTKKDPQADPWGLLPHFPLPVPAWLCPLHGMCLKGTLTRQHQPSLPLSRTVAGKPAKALTPLCPSLHSPPAVPSDVSTWEGSRPELEEGTKEGNKHF